MIVNMKKLIKQLNEIDIKEKNGNDSKFQALFGDLQGILNFAYYEADKRNVPVSATDLIEELENLVDRYR